MAKELKELQANKLIKRTVMDDLVVRIEYTVTDHAKTLQKVIEELHKWGLRHRKEVFGK